MRNKQDTRKLSVVIAILLIAIIALIAIVATLIQKQENQEVYVYDYESCAAAGYPTYKTLPPQCRGPNGTMYTKKPAPSLNESINNSSKEINFTELKKGDYNALIKREQRVIKTSAEWSKLWTEMFPTEMITSAINFNENMIIAVFQGLSPSGGYSIKIERIIDTGKELNVYVKEISPGKDCAVTLAMTSPYHIVELKKSNKPVNFIIQKEVVNC